MYVECRDIEALWSCLACLFLSVSRVQWWRRRRERRMRRVKAAGAQGLDVVL
jgi:hypothetical protein